MAAWKRCILLWVIVGLAACAPATRPQPEDRDVLRVGITPTAPPLIFKQGSDIVGLEADFARQFAKFLGKNLRFIEVAWEDQIPALLKGRTDIIMSGMSVTELRKVRIAFSTPYLRSGQMAMLRSEDVTLFGSGYFPLVKRESIGVVKDTTGQFFVEQARGYSTAKIVSFSTAREGVEALIDHRIDVFVHDAPVILYLASENETRGVTAYLSLLGEEDLAWGIRKDDSGLLEAANEFIRTIKNDGRLKSMAEQWIPFLK
jgi:ABC-type amino acid transport substrate-binding protein